MATPMKRFALAPPPALAPFQPLARLVRPLDRLFRLFARLQASRRRVRPRADQ